MAFMEQFRQRAQAVACAGAAHAKRLGAIAKLKADNMARQDTIHKSYTQLGQLWYSRNAQQPREPYAELCSRIAKAQAAIRDNNMKIQKLKEDKE